MKKHIAPITASPHHVLLMMTTSAAVIVHEILLMRLMSITMWQHVAYMVISMALLGFGTSGSLLFLAFKRIKKDVERWLLLLSCVAAVSYPASFIFSQKLGLDPLQLLWRGSEWLKMLLDYLLLAIPFLFSGGIIGIIISGAGEKVHRMYAMDLVGAGAGALLVVPALYLAPPWVLLVPTGVLVLAGSLGCCFHVTRPGWALMVLTFSGLLLVVAHHIMPSRPEIHNTKGLPMTLALPDARIEVRRVGPMGMIHVVDSAHIRHAPGLSLNFGLESETGAPQHLPRQKAIFVDGDGMSALSRFRGNTDELDHLDFTTPSLPYHVRRPQRVLIVGVGGGTDILLGIRHHTPRITAVEANGQMIDLLKGILSSFSGDLHRRPEVNLFQGEARQFLHATDGQFDLVQISLLDAFSASTGGLHASTENYLYTVEALEECLSRLTAGGILCLTRWLKLPPRDSLRMIATAAAALRRLNISHQPERHLICIRSWKTATLLVSGSPFTAEEVKRAKRFCEERGFDVSFYPGMREEEANRYDILQRPYYFLGAQALLGPQADAFIRDYVFDVSPTDDDRPYFYHFLKLKRIKSLFQQLRSEWLPMVEWGTIFVLATLVQASLCAVALILFPLLFLGRIQGISGLKKHLSEARAVFSTLAYFGAIGLAFMFLEMALIPRYTLLLSHPVYSAALVLSALLVFAGLGSFSSQRYQRLGSRFLWIPVGFIGFWIGMQVWQGPRMFQWALGWGFAGRFLLALSLLASLSFFLGWPFPAGLQVIGRQFPGLVPWAWGINGCASVVGAVLGKYLAVTWGFTRLMLAAFLLYLVAGFVFQWGINGNKARGKGQEAMGKR
jgi:spermidine synthase